MFYNNLLKEKSRFEKPSVKRRRKQREASERVFLANLREKQIASGEWEQRQKKKEQARAKKLQDRKNKAESSND